MAMKKKARAKAAKSHRRRLGPFDYLTQLLGGYTFGAKTNHDADGERTRELGAC